MLLDGWLLLFCFNLRLPMKSLFEVQLSCLHCSQEEVKETGVGKGENRDRWKL